MPSTLATRTVSMQSPPRALSQHLCTHTPMQQKLVARVTGHWLAAGQPAAGASSTETRSAYPRHHPLVARRRHLAHAVHVTHHHDAQHWVAQLKMMSEVKMNSAMHTLGARKPVMTFSMSKRRALAM